MSKNMNSLPDPMSELHIGGLSPEAHAKVTELALALGGVIMPAQVEADTPESTPPVADSFIRLDYMLERSRSGQPKAHAKKMRSLETSTGRPLVTTAEIQGKMVERLSLNTTCEYLHETFIKDVAHPGLGGVVFDSLLKAWYAQGTLHPDVQKQEIIMPQPDEALGGQPGITKDILNGFLYGLYGNGLRGKNVFYDMAATVLPTRQSDWRARGKKVQTDGINIQESHGHPQLFSLTPGALKRIFEAGEPNSLSNRYAVASYIKVLEQAGYTFGSQKEDGQTDHSGESSTDSRAQERIITSEELSPEQATSLLSSIFVEGTIAPEECGLTKQQLASLIASNMTQQPVEQALHNVHSRRNHDRASIPFKEITAVAVALGLEHDSNSLHDKLTKLHNRRPAAAGCTFGWLLHNINGLILESTQNVEGLAMEEAYLLSRYVAAVRAVRDERYSTRTP